MVDGLAHSPNILQSTCITQQYLFYGIITCKNRKCADSESQMKPALDIDAWCKFHKHGNLLHIYSIWLYTVAILIYAFYPEIQQNVICATCDMYL